MTHKNDRSQGKRIPCDFLNNLSSVDLFYEEKIWKKTPCKKMLGLYSAERLIATKQYADVPFVMFRDNFVLKPSLVGESRIFECLEPSLYPMKHLWSCTNKQNGDSVRFGVVKLCPTEMCHSQLWRPLLDYRWKTEGNNAPLEVFCSAKIVLFTTV